MILVIIVFALLAVGINTGGAMLSLTPLLGIGAMVIFVALFIGKKSRESVKGGPFAVCDVTALIAGYGGVIDCKLLECVLMDYRTEGDFQHLQVKAGMLLTRYENGGVCQYKSYLQLSLVKSIHALTQSINDVCTITTCPFWTPISFKAILTSSGVTSFLFSILLLLLLHK